MIDHRRLQRALFRMQLDPGFAPGAELGPRERALLAAAHPAAISADAGGRRRAQFLHNVTSEFPLSLATAKDAGLAERFTGSREFHDAVVNDASLPLAFAEYLAAAAPGPLVALETSLARARRARRALPALRPGEVALAPWAELLELPAGTLAAAERVRAALDAGATVPIAAVDGRGSETLLLRREPEPAPFRLASVEVELLSPALARLLERIAREREVSAAGLTRAELDEIVAGLVVDRVLVAG